MMNICVKKADILVLAYDCTNRSTFEDVPDTIKKLSWNMEVSRNIENNLIGR